LVLYAICHHLSIDCLVVMTAFLLSTNILQGYVRNKHLFGHGEAYPCQPGKAKGCGAIATLLGHSLGLHAGVDSGVGGHSWMGSDGS
jgi:hypothetical protein